MEEQKVFPSTLRSAMLYCMCGIAGILAPGAKLSRGDLESALTAMTHSIYHRGPDDEGHWLDPERGVGLGFRRLAILDLSEAGHQPMESACGRYVIVFNGEIYNYKDLKAEVLQTGQFVFPFRGRSDTEVLLSAITVWGIEETLSKANGMFAVALWDKEQQRLTLARDRLGEKPLYYGRSKGIFLFGSELKALESFPGAGFSVDMGAVNLFFRHNCIPAPYSIYEEVKKLPPATFVHLNTSTGEIGETRFYWSPKAVVEQGAGNRASGSFDEAVETLDDLLKSAIKMRMEADVPLGAFLSGGIDSTTMVALMQAQSSLPIRTFTIGFSEAQWDEAKFAKEIASHLRTEHTEFYVTPTEAQEVIPKLAGMFDEPFADSSQIPTYLVSRLARAHVTVSLSGDGGDELFGGYNRYIWGRTFWNRFGKIPGGFRAALSSGLRAVKPGLWDSLFHGLEPVLPAHLRWAAPGEKIQKLAQVMGVENPHELFILLTSHFHPPSQIALRGNEGPTRITDPAERPGVSDFTEQMMYYDLITYLPDDILTKVDRASMAVSLESRAPYLDPRVVEFAWRLPLQWRIQGHETKVLLRQLLYRYVPRKLMERPKMGFSIPIGDWVRGPLRDWAESLLSEKRLKEEGYLSPSEVRSKWEQHLSGARNWQHHLWDILMFQAWVSKPRR